jgi:type ISP restriction-modification system protein
VLFPFDARWIYYECQAKLLNESRPHLGEHLDANEFLVGAPQPRRVSESRPLLLHSLFDLHLHDWGSIGFPAEVRPNEGEGRLFKPKTEDLVPTANLSEGVWATAAWNLKGDLRGEAAKILCRSLFRYCTAIAHSPQYEEDNKESLLLRWHIPISRNKAEFDTVVSLGDTIATPLDHLCDADASIATLLEKRRRH